MKRTFVMAIGLPFSGKSTAAAEYRAKGWEVLERDELLEQILEHDDFKKMVAETVAQLPISEVKGLEWNIQSLLAGEVLAANIVEYARKTDKNVFYDGTNLKAETRFPILQELKDEMDVDALVFQIPLESILERARQAGEQGSRTGFHAEIINEKQLRLMADWFTPPARAEGFRAISEYKPPSEPGQELKTEIEMR